ncbi:ABZJ_00895 family protein [Thioclava litoralis]|uniref:ABZJ_00895 family protein n=1 Tax=Thioclava litoralis TaxID=3076557 RepID=A0ABZ1E2S6_9RHOB|nr:ABZJ_00895 family protein [Thioclava sp. FTW29]
MNYLRYLACFVGVSVLASVLLAVLRTAGVPLSGAAFGAVPILVAAMVEGQGFARKYQRSPRAGEAWGFALKAFVLVALVELGLGTLAWFFLPGAQAGVSAGQLPLFLAIIFGLTFLLVVLISRFFYSTSAKNYLKAMEKKAQKLAKRQAKA